MSARPPGEVLDVADVMARYGLRDRRAARRLMDAAGGFIVGGRLVVRVGDLLQYEEALREERRAVRTEPAPAPHPPRRRGVAMAPPRDPLRPGWWRNLPRDRDAA
jgi:hypothetical protein